MPTKPRRHALSKSAVGRNPQADERRMRDEVLAAVKRFRSSIKWQNFQAWFMRKHPLCADPFNNHKRDNKPVPAESVHHVIQLAEDLSLGLVEENCRGLCNKCHNAIGAIERKNLKKAKRIFISREQENEIKKNY
jgi:5-methylcytosine-specific restriction endonuclease McrA